jgi:hypothetical protein
MKYKNCNVLRGWGSEKDREDEVIGSRNLLSIPRSDLQCRMLLGWDQHIQSRLR